MGDKEWAGNLSRQHVVRIWGRLNGRRTSRQWKVITVNLPPMLVDLPSLLCSREEMETRVR